MQEAKSISVIIPTLNAGKYLRPLIERLKKQTIVPLEIVIVDSESTDETIQIAKKEGITILPIKRADYDHGGTRNYAVAHTKGEYILFLSQDALPVDEYYVENLISGFVDEDVVMISARQIARENATQIEKLTREFNYKHESFTRTKADIPKLGIKAYFFSDVCSAYRRDFFLEAGGFESPILTNEDMLMASCALKAGKKIGYSGKAQVYHSHNYTLKQQYKRNFDISVFLQMHAMEIESGSSTGEGIRMVLFIEKELLRRGKIISAIKCILDSGAKYMGNRAGKKYTQMSEKEILCKTSNPTYWNRYFEKREKVE